MDDSLGHRQRPWPHMNGQQQPNLCVDAVHTQGGNRSRRSVAYAVSQAREHAHDELYCPTFAL
jgi:hypothetical protein